MYIHTLNYKFWIFSKHGKSIFSNMFIYIYTESYTESHRNILINYLLCIKNTPKTPQYIFKYPTLSKKNIYSKVYSIIRINVFYIFVRPGWKLFV